MSKFFRALIFLAIPAYIFGGAIEIPEQPLEVPINITPQILKLSEGKGVTIAVEFVLPSDVHLNSDPAPRITVFDADWLEFSKPTLEGAKKWDALLEADIYSGTVIAKQSVRLNGEISPGTYTIKAELSYYPCDDKTGICYRMEKEISCTVEVSGATSKIGGIKAFVNRFKDVFEGGDAPLAVVFLMVFIGGVLSSFTPCVYPMIPITVGYFASRSASRARTFVGVGLYVFGIAMVYALLGLFSAFGGQAFGALTQKPAVLFGVAGVLFVMAISLLGYFEINFLMFRPAQGISYNGYFGALGMGAMAGLVASPCITPVLVSLLAYVAKRANPLLGFSLLFVFALGLGMLLAAIALFSGFARFLPKSGGWMVGMQFLMGIILIAVSVYYFGLGGELLGFNWWFGAAISGGVGLFLVGHSLRAHRITAEPSRAIRATGVVIMIAGGLFFAAGLVLISPLGWMFFDLEADDGTGVQWIKDDYETAFSRAKAEGKPVLADFWAPWCYYCKKLDRTAWRDPQVVELAHRNFIPLKINADKFPNLVKQYKVRGLPSVLIISPDGALLGRVDSFIKTEEMLRFLGSVPVSADD